jgi:antitoxin FitA
MHAMKNIQIRNVPEKTHSVLMRRAAAAGMSLQGYLLSMINAAAGKPSIEDVLQRVERRSGAAISMREVVAALREDRDGH